MTLDYKENGKKKAFLATPKHQYRVSQCGEQDCSASNIRNGDYHKHPSLTISRMNFDSKENGERKAFLVNMKH